MSGEGRREETSAHKMATATWRSAVSPSVLPASGAFMKAAIDPRPGHLHGQLAQRMFICRCRPFHVKLPRSESDCPDRRREKSSEAPGEPALPEAIFAGCAGRVCA